MASRRRRHSARSYCHCRCDCRCYYCLSSCTRLDPASPFATSTPLDMQQYLLHLNTFNRMNVWNCFLGKQSRINLFFPFLLPKCRLRAITANFLSRRAAWKSRRRPSLNYQLKLLLLPAALISWTHRGRILNTAEGLRVLDYELLERRHILACVAQLDKNKRQKTAINSRRRRD